MKTNNILQEKMNKLQARYSRILNYSFEEIYIFQDSNLLFTEVSKGTLKNLGYTADEIKHISPIDIKPLMSAAEFNKLIQPLRDGTKNILKFETIHERKDGSTYDVAVRLQYINDDNPVFIAMVTDITERNQYEEELKTLAFRDPGTDLYNKRFFMEALDVSISKSSRDRSAFGLVLIDLDDFSLVNNTHGHIVGDLLIKEIADRISNAFPRSSDIVARYGGDEFVVLCYNMSPEMLKHKCNMLIKEIAKEFKIDGKAVVQHSASVGLCYCKGHNKFSPKELLENADIAMYDAKHSGKNQLKVYDEIR